MSTEGSPRHFVMVGNVNLNMHYLITPMELKHITHNYKFTLNLYGMAI